MTFGGTVCAWPGCPEGRGFDELGEKGFYSGTIDDSGKVSLTFVPFARRRYEILTVDVTDQDPRAAIERRCPPTRHRTCTVFCSPERPVRAASIRTR